MRHVPRLALSLSLLAAVLASGAAPAAAQDRALDDAERSAVVDAIAAELDARYVFPGVAERCGAHLHAQLAAGAWSEVSDPEAFADALTAALQEISNDKHLRVRARRPAPPPAEPDREGAGAPQDPGDEVERMREGNFGFRRVETLDGNVGYLDLRGFLPLELARETATGAMAFLANSDALIVDLRQNGGGSPRTVQFLCSYFFDEPTHLNSLYWRAGDRTEEFWTHPVPGRSMADVPLFVLTSDYTFSGAEEFAYNLRTRERATLVGETTGGGANPGGTVEVGERFLAFVPTGRAINPVTGTNWEGVGVEPHLAVSADEALERATQEARKAADAYRAERRSARAAARETLRAELAAAKQAVEAGDAKGAEPKIRAALEAGLAADVLDEMAINMLGYEHLGAGDVDVAIPIFRFNTDRFPESSNVWDSLGEAWMVKGDVDAAIRNYQKSLELDPTNENAKRMIERMRAK